MRSIRNDKMDKKYTIKIKINNCIDCLHHDIQPDPDPDDWFNNDDIKVYCEKAKKYITRMCRPHHTRDECNIPDWCPLLED